MTVTLHTLGGCAPIPLAHYLKALGVLRLVGEQSDVAARGCWNGEVFQLLTQHDREDLLRFFLEDYQPTPLVAPWNGGSGFYPKDAKAGVDAIAASRAERLATYRDAIQAGRLLTGGLTKRPEGDEKDQMLRQCRRTWRGPLLQWFEAAVVIGADASPAYPALLGTGGNDGRLDFTNNFMQRITELLDVTQPKASARPASRSLLEAALYGDATPGLASVAVGQFLPGGAGGANSGSGFTGPALINPWDFVLMLEGTVLFSSSIVRRSRADAAPLAAAPFATRNDAVGYASAAAGESSSRGEQWMPLWRRPMALSELRSLITEGRARLGRQSASRPTDFGRALARLGVARGISAFQRFGYIERNGQANLAVPLGRWQVGLQPHQELLDEVVPWLERLRRAAAVDHAPGSFGRASRLCDEAVIECSRHGENPERWRRLLVLLGEAEAMLVRAPRFTAERALNPLPRLSASWLDALADGSELRLALALATQRGVRRRGDGAWELDPADSIRRHFLPLADHGRFAKSSDGTTLLNAPSWVCRGSDLERACVELVGRRIAERAQSRAAGFPLAAAPGAQAQLGDMVALLDGQLDEQLVLGLARPLLALNWPTRPRRQDAPSRSDVISTPTLFALFRMACRPPRLGSRPSDQENTVRLDPAIWARLVAGDLPQAASIAIRRLSASGMRPHIWQATGSSSLARRIALSLAFPLSDRTLDRLAERLTYQPETD